MQFLTILFYFFFLCSSVCEFPLTHHRLFPRPRPAYPMAPPRRVFISVTACFICFISFPVDSFSAFPFLSLNHPPVPECLLFFFFPIGALSALVSENLHSRSEVPAPAPRGLWPGCRLCPRRLFPRAVPFGFLLKAGDAVSGGRNRGDGLSG